LTEHVKLKVEFCKILALRPDESEGAGQDPQDLRVSPLRERKEDIPLLVKCFLKDFVLKEGEVEKTITNDALAMLIKHDWPGNVRELKNIAERLVIMTAGNIIDENDIPPFVKEDEISEPDTSVAALDSYRSAKAAFERQYIAGKLKIRLEHFPDGRGYRSGTKQFAPENKGLRSRR